MKLYLLRHAEAAPTYPDAARVLTAKGRATADALGKFLAARGGLPVEMIWHSPYARARETAERVAAVLGLGHLLREMPDITPEDDVRSILPAINALTAPCLLVGHNPHLTFLLSALLTGRELGLPVNFKKGALATLEGIPLTGMNPAGYEYWTLQGFLVPAVYS